MEIINYAAVPLVDKSAYILLIEVQYESGLPETYQLILTYIKKHLATTIEQNDPQAVLSQIKVGDENGILCDALYVPQVLHTLLANLAGNKQLKDSAVIFYSAAVVKKYLEEKTEIKAGIFSGDPYNTSIGYNSRFFLKIYRKVDAALNSDVEITRFLEEKADFKHIPAFLGAIEWKSDKGTMTLGMLQEMIENHGNGHLYMLERLNNFIERILARAIPAPAELQGTLTEPVAFEELPEDLKDLLGARTAEQARLIGMRTADLHKALASGTYDASFAPEDFSLHYQRSLFASMQSLVRETFQKLQKDMPDIRQEIKDELQSVLNNRDAVLALMKRIYNKKLDAVKMRIHGNYHLGQVLLTGKDVAITDFGGDAFKTYSERRLKKSPLRDVATMLRSFYYVAYEGIFQNSQVPEEETGRLVPYARLWAHYVGGFFMEAYLEGVQDTLFIPEEKEDLRMMLQIFLLEKALSDLNYEKQHRPEWIVVPLRMVLSIIKQK
jgi:maltose alpha-D-glucosyltransferase/alpha-amylase